MASGKDVIYIDPEDEITAVIEKVQLSKNKIVALVLPKRASVFQSVVNLRLLKRSVDTAKKNLVLITSEPSILPLAGVAELHVAKTLQSKPVIPSAPAMPSDAPVDAEEVEEDVSLDKTASIGSLAGDEDTIEIDNDEPVKPAAKSTVAKAGAGFNRKLKVPNFDRFRKGLIFGGAVLVLLIIGFIYAAIALPKATITVKTDTTDVRAQVDITALPSIDQADVANKTLPATVKEIKKSESVKVAATGQKDMGEKASGKVALKLTDCSQPSVTVPSGTTVSAGNFNFITQESATLLSTIKGGKCSNDADAEATVAVAAQNAGDSYNLSARDYSVSGFSNVSGRGGAMSGGVSRIVKVVSQQDIDGAKARLLEPMNASSTQELSDQLKNDAYFALTDTYVAKDPLVVANPAVDSEAEEVTVNVSAAFTMTGVARDGLVSILEENIKSQIDASRQNILDNGLEQGAIRIDSKKPNGETKFSLETTAKAGVEQNEAEIKAAIAGMKKGEVKNELLDRPGVRDVVVEYSPFWVAKAPKNPEKITLIFEQQ